MQRMLQLLLLLSGKKWYSCNELASRLQLSQRTILRYLDTFDTVGFLVERRQSHYRLKSERPETKALQQSLHFSEEELYLLHKAIGSLAPAHKTALRLQQKLHTLYGYKALAQAAQKMDAAKIAVLGEAMEKKCCVQLMGYRSINSQTIANRLVEPFAFQDDYTAVWCWERPARGNKVFLVSRIEKVVVTNERWQHEAAHQLPFCDAFRLSAPQPVAQVKARLSLKAANLLQEEYPLAEKHIQPKNGMYRLCIPVADFKGIGRFVLGLPGEVMVEGPAAFVSYLEEMRKKVWGGVKS